MALIINIDAGHGSNTAGKRTPPMPINIDFDGDGVIDVKKGNSILEHYANVGVAVLLEKELHYNGFTTAKTGWDDANASDDPDTALTERQKMIAKNNCDMSVSIHMNAHGDGKSFTSGEGFSVFYHSDLAAARKSKGLAQAIEKELAANTVQKNRGAKPNGLAMCNAKNMGVDAAVVVECAFMTNERESRLVGSADFWLECAQEICRGICKYYGITYKKRPISTISVKDEDGKVTGSVKITYYVRKTFASKSSQIGAFSNLDYAKAKVDGTTGYKVFDKNGTVVYEKKVEEVKKPTHAPVKEVVKPAAPAPKKEPVKEEVKKPTPVPAPVKKEEPKVTKVVISKNGVNIRKYPRTLLSPKLGAVARGQKVEVLKVSGSWYYVAATTTSGKKVTGWCIKKAF